jgi:hypothetical protein
MSSRCGDDDMTVTRFARRALVAAVLAVVAMHAAVTLAKVRREFFIVTYLSWERNDTSTSMTVHYITQARYERSQVLYDTVSRGGDPEAYRQRVIGRTRWAGGKKRYLHHAELVGLEPHRTYYYIVGDEISGFSDERKFRTIRNDGGPVRFVVGGDLGPFASTATMMKVAAGFDPDFAMVGGDIAYANGKHFFNWETLFRMWHRAMVTPDGYSIPIVAAAGNHETGGRPYYKRLLRQGGRSYFKRTFGPNLVSYILDSGNFARHGGRQSRWLRRAMQTDRDVPATFAVYHHPLYPAHKGFNEEDAFRAGRKHWGPIFDRFDLTAAFEHHDHVYKRSKLLENNDVSRRGTLYIGGGAWGVAARRADKRWYLRKARSAGHVVVVEVDHLQATLLTVNRKGRAIDSVDLDL